MSRAAEELWGALQVLREAAAGEALLVEEASDGGSGSGSGSGNSSSSGGGGSGGGVGGGSTRARAIRLHACEVPGCTYRGRDRGNLNRHIRTHTGERPFVCTAAGCSYASTTRECLARHAVRHEERIYCCEEEACDYTSTQRGHFVNHSRVVHSSIFRERQRAARAQAEVVAV